MLHYRPNTFAQTTFRSSYPLQSGGGPYILVQVESHSPGIRTRACFSLLISLRTSKPGVDECIACYANLVLCADAAINCLNRRLNGNLEPFSPEAECHTNRRNALRGPSGDANFRRASSCESCPLNEAGCGQDSCGRHAQTGALYVGDHLQHGTRMKILFSEFIGWRAQNDEVRMESPGMFGDQSSRISRCHDVLHRHRMRLVEGCKET